MRYGVSPKSFDAPFSVVTQPSSCKHGSAFVPKKILVLFFKYSASRAPWSLLQMAETQPILCKREQKIRTDLIHRLGIRKKAGGTTPPAFPLKTKEIYIKNKKLLFPAVQVLD